MLGRAAELAPGLETPASLGAHHPYLPARALLSQHPIQCQPVAPVMARRCLAFRGLFGRAAGYGLFAAASNLPIPKPPAPVHSGETTDFAILDGTGERYITGSHLDRRVFGQNRGVAWTKNEGAPRRHSIKERMKNEE